MMIRSFVLILFNLLLLGCADAPSPEPTPPLPPPPPTVVNLQIESATDINPDGRGVASPVMLRIYELREISTFNSADFFALFDKEQATLAADLAHKQEFFLKPGDSKTLTIEPGTDVRSLGFFAAFRQLDTAQWRAVTPVMAHQTLSIKVKLQGNELIIQPVDPQGKELPIQPLEPPAKELPIQPLEPPVKEMPIQPFELPSEEMTIQPFKL
jgi:type VI secretion system protein VasD